MSSEYIFTLVFTLGCLACPSHHYAGSYSLRILFYVVYFFNFFLIYIKKTWSNATMSINYFLSLPKIAYPTNAIKNITIIESIVTTNPPTKLPVINNEHIYIPKNIKNKKHPMMKSSPLYYYTTKIQCFQLRCLLFKIRKYNFVF